VRLKTQIAELYEMIKKLNPYFWPALVYPRGLYSPGYAEQTEVALLETQEAWREAYVAVDAIEMAIKKRDFSDPHPSEVYSSCFTALSVLGCFQGPKCNFMAVASSPRLDSV
jgi:hypothetical protein